MTRPWLTLPPLLADHARQVRLLHLTTRELRDLNRMPPAEIQCWRTTAEGRAWQAQLTQLINGGGPYPIVRLGRRDEEVTGGDTGAGH